MVGRNPTPPSLRRGQALWCCLSPELGRAEACEGGPTPPSLRRGQALWCCLSPELGRAEACEGGPTPPKPTSRPAYGFPQTHS
jgi:hypothetical protein